MSSTTRSTREQRFVDADKTIQSRNVKKADKLLKFHQHLASKNLFQVPKQFQFIKKIDLYVKQAIREEDRELLEFCKYIMESHFKNLLFQRHKLNSKGYNPFTVFLKDCENTKVQESPLGASYINFLISEDDNFIHQSIYENVRDNCQSSMFKIAKEVKKEDSEDDSEDEREEESEDDRSDEDEKLRELYQQYSPVTQRRIQRMLRQSHFIF